MNGLVLKYPGCTLEELDPTLKALAGRVGLRATPLGEIEESASPDFLLIPGGTCEDAVMHNGLHRLIQRVHAKEGILAAICNGAFLLASAGVLRGRKCTHTAHPNHAPLPDFQELIEAAAIYFEGSHFIDEDVVQDGKIITAKPWAKVSFAETVVSAITSRKSNHGN